MKLDIKQYLQSIPKDQTLYYFPNPGNGGDSLIAYATFQLFDEAGLIYYPLPEDTTREDLVGKTLICPGGGNLISYYPNTRNIIQKYHDVVSKLIVLPHTIFGHEDLLEQLGSNTDIITRENISYDYVSKTAKKANVFIAHDMAFSLDTDQVLHQIPILFSAWMSTTIPSRRIQKGNSFEIQHYFQSRQFRHDYKVLNAFRRDEEKTTIQIPEDNIDIANKFAYGTTKRRALYASNRLLSFVNQYQKVRTNRLHTCVAAALLGKEVEFYANNYFKCKAVYQFSIKDQFPKVRWMD